MPAPSCRPGWWRRWRDSCPARRAPSPPAASSWRAPYPVGDDLTELIAAVLLQEMPGTLDGGVRLTPRSRHSRQEQLIRPTRDRVGVTEGAQPRPVKGLQHPPRRDVLGGPRLI